MYAAALHVQGEGARGIDDEVAAAMKSWVRPWFA